MANLKRVAVDEGVPVRLSVGDRGLIVDHTLADPGLTDRLNAAVPNQSRITVYYTLAELEDLLGFIAAEANHARDRKIQRQLDKLYDRVSDLERKYAYDDSTSGQSKLAT